MRVWARAAEGFGAMLLKVCRLDLGLVVGLFVRLFSGLLKDTYNLALKLREFDAVSTVAAWVKDDDRSPQAADRRDGAELRACGA